MRHLLTLSRSWPALSLLITIFIITSGCAQASQRASNNNQSTAPRPSAQVNNVLYNPPPGWQKIEQNGGLIYFPAEFTKNNADCLLTIFPGQTLQGNFRAAFERVLKAAHSNGKVLAGGKITETTADEGYPVLYTDVAFEDGDGTRSLRFYVAANPPPGDRFELITYFASTNERYQKYQPDFDTFLKSVDFASRLESEANNTANNSNNNNGGNRNRPAATGNGLSGLYVGTESRQQFNPNTKYYDYIVRQIYYLFLPDGRVYAGLPKGGELDNFNFDRINRTDPNNCGFYQINGGEISFKIGNREPFSSAFVNNRDTIQIGRNKLYAVSNADGLRLNGSYGMRGFTNTSAGSNTGGVSSERTIIFNNNGQFAMQGFVGVTGSGGNVGFGSSSVSNGSGNYRIVDNTLELSYSDGRRAQLTFFVYPENVRESRPGLIVIDGVSFLLRN